MSTNTKSSRLISHSLIESQQATRKMFPRLSNNMISEGKSVWEQRVEPSWRYLLCTHIIILTIPKYYMDSLSSSKFSFLLLFRFLFLAFLCVYFRWGVSLFLDMFIYNNINEANVSGYKRDRDSDINETYDFIWVFFLALFLNSPSNFNFNAFLDSNSDSQSQDTKHLIIFHIVGNWFPFDFW